MRNNYKKILKFNWVVVLILNFLISWLAIRYLTHLRIESLIQTLVIQEKWDGTNKDNYSFGIIVEQFLIKSNLLNSTKISVIDAAHTEFLKISNSDSFFPIPSILNMNFKYKTGEKTISINASSTNRLITLLMILSILLTVIQFISHSYLKRSISYYQKLKLSNQVAHDIKAPITALNTILNNSDDLNTDQINLIRGAISRIKDISSDLNNSGSSNIRLEKLSLSKGIKQIELEFNARGLNLEVKVQSSLNSNAIFFTTEHIRHIVNLLNNSFDASKVNDIVNLQLSLTEKQLCLEITDSGIGMSTDILDKLNNGISTTHGKHNGQGIGTYYAKKFFESLGGSLVFISQINVGTRVRATFPIMPSTYVQLEDDYFLRKSWAIDAQKYNLNLLTFSTEMELFKKIDTIPKDAHFYIDQNLGEKTLGVEVAKKLFDKGFKNLFLSSGDDTIDLSAYPFLKSNFSKEPPWIA